MAEGKPENPGPILGKETKAMIAPASDGATNVTPPSTPPPSSLPQSSEAKEEVKQLATAAKDAKEEVKDVGESAEKAAKGLDSVAKSAEKVAENTEKASEEAVKVSEEAAAAIKKSFGLFTEEFTNFQKKTEENDKNLKSVAEKRIKEEQNLKKLKDELLALQGKNEVKKEAVVNEEKKVAEGEKAVVKDEKALVKKAEKIEEKKEDAVEKQEVQAEKQTELTEEQKKRAEELAKLIVVSEKSIEESKSEQNKILENQTGVVKELETAIGEVIKESGQNRESVLAVLRENNESVFKILDSVNQMNKYLDPDEKAMEADPAKKDENLPDWAKNMIAGYDEMKGFAKDFRGWMSGGNWFSKWFKRIMISLSLLAGFVVGWIATKLSYFGLSLDKLKDFFAPVAKFFENFGAGASKFFEPIRRFLAPITRHLDGVVGVLNHVSGGGLTRIGSYFTTLFKQMGSAFKFAMALAKPITIIIDVIVALVSTVRGFMREGLKGALKGLLVGIIQAFTLGFFKFDQLYEAVSRVMDPLFRFFNHMYKLDLKSAMKDFTKYLLEFIVMMPHLTMELVAKIFDFFGLKSVAKFLRQSIENTRAAIDKVVEFVGKIGEYMEPFFRFLRILRQIIVNYIVKYVMIVYEYFSRAFGRIIESISTIVNFFKGKISFGDMLKKLGNLFIDQVKDYIVTTKETILLLIRAGFNTLKAFFRNLLPFLLQLITDTVVLSIKAGVAAFKFLFIDLPRALRKFVTEDLPKFFTGAYNATEDFILELPDTMERKVWPQVRDFIIQSLVQIAATVARSIDEIINEIKKGINEVLGFKVFDVKEEKSEAETTAIKYESKDFGSMTDSQRESAIEELQKTYDASKDDDLVDPLVKERLEKLIEKAKSTRTVISKESETASLDNYIKTRPDPKKDPEGFASYVRRLDYGNVDSSVLPQITKDIDVAIRHTKSEIVAKSLIDSKKVIGIKPTKLGPPSPSSIVPTVGSRDGITPIATEVATMQASRQTALSMMQTPAPAVISTTSVNNTNNKSDYISFTSRYHNDATVRGTQITSLPGAV